MKFLLIRMSAIGDVAMTLPIAYAIANRYPQHHFTFLTQPFLTQLFIDPPKNLQPIGIRIKAQEKSFRGLLHYAKNLCKESFDVVIDMHNVLRSQIISIRLKLNGAKVYTLKKHRYERYQLYRQGKNKKKEPIQSMHKAYLELFHSAHLPINEEDIKLPIFHQIEKEAKVLHKLRNILNLKDNKKTPRLIGVAPFAGHKGKIYPLNKMYEVCHQLASCEDVQILLFGGKGKEDEQLKEFCKKDNRLISLVGAFSLDEELALIAKLDLMISMDSANMHFASLVATPVLSIWLNTHPYMGFLGLNQKIENTITLDMPCAPCSVFGNKDCYRGDYACQNIMPETIITKVKDILKLDI